MSNLQNLLAQPPVTETKFDRQKVTFKTEIDPVDPNRQSIEMTYPGKLAEEADWKQAVIDMGGLEIAPGYRVRLVEMRLHEGAWVRNKQGEDAVTEPKWFYRFAVEPIVATLHASADEIIKSIGRKRPRVKTPAPTDDPWTYHFLAGDTQLGKVDGDGTEGIVESVTRSIDKSLDEYKYLRKKEKVGLVHLAWLGDCIEGNQSQNGRNMWRTHLTVTEQVRVFRRLMLYAVDAFLPYAERIEVDVVNGNHDEVQRFVSTRPDDGHATEAAISLWDAMQMNVPVYGGVQMFVPEKDSSYMTRQVGSSIFTMAHGHQWRRGKAWDWWAGQALNFQNAGTAHFLAHGHYHTAGIDTKRDRTILSVPTHESESQWWKEKTGDLAKRGSFSLLSKQGDFSHLSII